MVRPLVIVIIIPVIVVVIVVIIIVVIPIVKIIIVVVGDDWLGLWFGGFDDGGDERFEGLDGGGGVGVDGEIGEVTGLAAGVDG